MRRGTYVRMGLFSAGDKFDTRATIIPGGDANPFTAAKREISVRSLGAKTAPSEGHG